MLAQGTDTYAATATTEAQATCSTHDGPSWPSATPTEDLKSLSSAFCHYRSVLPFLRFQINGFIWCELSVLGFFHSAKEMRSFLNCRCLSVFTAEQTPTVEMNHGSCLPSPDGRFCGPVLSLLCRQPPWTFTNKPV